MALYYIGKQGSIAIGNAVFPLDKWELTSETQAVEVSNFSVPFGQEAYVPNLIGGTISCSGPLTSLGTPNNADIAGRPCAGQYAVFTLGVGIGLSYAVTALIDSIKPSQDVKDKASVEITATVSPNPNLL
jgi:hypothetical protein